MQRGIPWQRLALGLALVGLSGVVACGGTVRVDADGSAGAGPAQQGGAPGSAGALSFPRPAAAGSGNAGTSSGGAQNFAGSVGDAGDAGASGSCVVDGVSHKINEQFACDCNTCWCESDGQVYGTLIGCISCEYNGQTYAYGQTFPDKDGCNQCTCGADGQASCTEGVCNCDPANEWWRTYVGTPAQCEVIDYTCQPPNLPFSNSCGCGCELKPEF